MANQFDPWSKDELNILKDTSLTHNDVVEATGRSYSAVKRKRLELGVKAKTEMNYWSPEEIKFLTKNRNLSNIEVADKLGRTPGAVSIKRQKLNLAQFTDKWDAFEIEYLVTNYNSIKNEAIADFLGRSLTAITTKAYELGISKKSDFWSKKETQLLLDNFDALLDELCEIITTKSKAQIAYKRTFIRSKQKENVNKSDFEISSDRNFNGRNPKAGQYMDALSVMNIGDSMEFPSNEYQHVLKAIYHFPNKFFRTKKSESSSSIRIIWRLG